MKNRNNILEASLSRIWRDFEENEFCIITSWRTDDKSNKENLSGLKSMIRGAGFGYVRIDGVGQEEVDGRIKSVKEPSLLVKNVKEGGDTVMDSKKFESFMVNLGRIFNQWGIVLHNPKKGTRLIALKDDEGNQIAPKVDMKMSSFNPMKTGQFFSSLKGKPFKFEGFKYADPPQNWIQGMSMEKEGHSDIYRYETMESWMKQIEEILSSD